ncbi:MAG: hypothetical protein IIA33_11570, partial [Planctomycetes bacterium]|nr:hypothetical protein [Planctomycetota bacterium]
MIIIAKKKSLRRAALVAAVLLVCSSAARADDFEKFQERARQHLIAAGEVDLAHRLAAARMGTVNGVCGQLVSQFAFELGQAPELRVLDEDLATQALDRALSAAMASDIEVELSALRERMEEFEWNKFLPDVVQRVRTNGLAPDQLGECAKKSWQGMQALFGTPVKDGSKLTQNLLEALDKFVEVVSKGSDTTLTTQRDAVPRARRAAERLRKGQDLAWREWA